jgi:FixJ family two-component response regulator
MIAIVDDDPATCLSVQRLLHSYGLPAQTFFSAEELLASTELHAVDCLILDVQMPGMTGLELHDHLLKIGARIPIIYITGYVDDAVQARFKTMGTVTVLEKPFDEEVLISHVHAANNVFHA